MNKFGWLLFLSASCAARLAGAGDPSVPPAHLRCEDLADPLGIDVPAPRLSWILPSGRRGDRQTAYQILVSGRRDILEQGKGDLWDSGRVVSDQSIFVPYAGAALDSGEDCWWRVRVWDAEGNPTPWSEPARWSMGLLHPEDWTGKWIGRDETLRPVPFTGAWWIWTGLVPPPVVTDALTRYFRGVVELPAGSAVRSAHLLVVSPGTYAACVNGVRLRVQDEFVLGTAQDIDVTWSLRAGRNVVAFSAQPDRSPGVPAGIAAKVVVDLMDGRRLTFSTDRQWRASAFPEPGWEGLEYDDSAWPAARAEVEAGGAPWGPLVQLPPRRLAARWLRRDFEVGGEVSRAMVYYSGVGWSELYLNGQRVGDEELSPGLSQIPERVFYVTHDVTSLVRNGANAIGAVLGNGRYFAPRRGAPFGDVFPKLMLKLVVELKDGRRVVVSSDERWKLTDGGPIRANNDYDGEEYDARREMPGWSEPGYPDRDWEAARAVAPAARVLSSPLLPPIRVTETRAAIAEREISPGVFLFDLGQNMVGRCRLRVKGPAGATVTLRHAETLDGAGFPRFENLRTALATDTYTLKGGGQETYEPRFTSHGFRYVEVRGYPGRPPLEAIEGRVVGDDMERTGSWTCSNDLLNRIYEGMAWGIRGNYRSIPTDCPQRDERQGWTGDRVFESRGEAFLYDVAPLYRKWLQDMADTQRADGSLSDVCPSYWPYYNEDVTWAGCFVLAPEDMYEQFGDVGFLTRNYAAMRKWVVRTRRYLANGVLTNDRYGDWCPPPADNRTLIHNQDPFANTSGAFLASSHYYYILRLMERYAAAAGNPGDARTFADDAARLKADFNRTFLSADGTRYDTGSQTSYVLPLAFGLAPDANREAIGRGLADRVAGVDGGHVQTGLVGVKQLMRALSGAGRDDLAYRLAVQDSYPSWGYMVRHGATTIWELWDGDTAEASMNSGNHVMLIGDSVIWLYEDVAGIRADPAEPGFKHIIMRPSPVGDLRFVRASHFSPYGRIVSEWSREAGRLAWHVVVPANARATLYVPARSAADVSEGGVPVDRSAGIRLVGQAGDRVQLEAGAGDYRFVAEGN
ncbi:MAG: family 78 glycoside hydrolase catalytic domain [Opitutaceae bacterium]|jgi:alpha-L-rhamnosidase